MRVDERLVREALAEDLDMAGKLVMAGRVYLGEEKVAKPSDPCRPGFALSVRESKPYVSRGALKLLRAIDAFDLSVDSKVCIDVGASTGGFTDVMLRGGARCVYAVDVGYGLLDWKIRNDARVRVMERTNARFLKKADFDPAPSFGATDVSFISLKAVLPAVLPLLTGEDARFVALIKPQFEAVKELVRGGVVADPDVHADVIGRIVRFVDEMGWRPERLAFSPIRGAKGNAEFLLLISRASPGGTRVTDEDIRSVAAACHAHFFMVS
jgi:23S rRNA (cytidine1920-2'-O)/16S rRNA (cytidine1409-2'-O)-methyltransferase